MPRPRSSPSPPPAGWDNTNTVRPSTRRQASAIRRRQLHHLNHLSHLGHLNHPNTPSTPNHVQPARPLRPSERYLAAASTPHANTLTDTLANTLANTRTRTHTRTTTTTANTNIRPRSRSPTFAFSTDRRHTKRRKLDHDASTAASPYDGFKYGYKGQVVPGRLRMDIVSCDGGEYRKDNPSGLYNIQNVLKNDKSVYCSETASCNLLLKHIADAPFALEKLVIRAPDRGFTAPVQEGLVFVSMSADQLLAGTSAYQLQYHSSPIMSPTPSSPAVDDDDNINNNIDTNESNDNDIDNDNNDDDDDDNEQLSLQEAMGDPTIWERIQRPSSIRPRQPRNHTSYPPVEPTTTGDDLYTDICDDPTVPPFTVTTATEEEDDEDEDDDEDSPPSAAIIADRLRRESRWRAESDDDQDEDNDIIPRFGGLRRAPPLDYTSYGDWRDWRESLRASQLGGPSRIAPVHVNMTSGSEDVITPHARFFIKKNRSKITIKFQPAVSGRHILLKLWSPTHDGNIDIESVQFYGFAGPRFFPSTQMC